MKKIKHQTKLEQAIRQYCEEHDMYLKEFAEKIGVSRQYLDWLFKKKIHNIHVAQKYAKIIGRDFAELFL